MLLPTSIIKLFFCPFFSYYIFWTCLMMVFPSLSDGRITTPYILGKVYLQFYPSWVALFEWCLNLVIIHSEIIMGTQGGYSIIILKAT